jgi:hypothetical protein
VPELDNCSEAPGPRVERNREALARGPATRTPDAQPSGAYGIDKSSTVAFPAPLMSTIQELGAFLTRESSAVVALPVTAPAVAAAATTNGEHAAS